MSRFHLVLLGCVLVTAPTAAQVELIDTLTANDAIAFHGFGWSVDIRGDIAITGAPLDGDVADAAGAAYVHDLTTGQQTSKLLPPSLLDDAGWWPFTGSVEGLNAGLEVAIRGGEAFLATQRDRICPYPGEPTMCFIPHGVAIKCDMTTGETSEMGGSSAFGGHVTATDDYYVISDSDGFLVEGIGKTTLGTDVGCLAAHGNTIVGGQMWASVAAVYSGAAYVVDATTGDIRLTLEPEDVVERHLFGTAVDVCGNTIIVGAADGGVYGSAYLFDATTGEQTGKLLPPPGTHDDIYWNFGLSVAINEHFAAVGAWDSLYNGEPGSVFVYYLQTGELVTTLAAPGVTTANYFGQALAMDGQTLLVGAPKTEVDGLIRAGAVYVYNLALRPGDADGDGDVDLDDFVIVKSHFGTGTTRAQGDFDGDQDVDLDDFALLKLSFGL